MPSQPSLAIVAPMLASTAWPAPCFASSNRMPVERRAATAIGYDSGCQRAVGTRSVQLDRAVAVDVDVELDLGVVVDVGDQVELDARAVAAS